MYLPNVNGDEIVGSVIQMLGGREQLQILHFKNVNVHWLADLVMNSVRFSLNAE